MTDWRPGTFDLYNREDDDERFFGLERNVAPLRFDRPLIRRPFWSRVRIYLTLVWITVRRGWGDTRFQ